MITGVEISQSSVLRFGCAVEVGTGLALMVAPAFVVGLLLGLEPSASVSLLARFFAIALVALGLACWPQAVSGLAAFRGLLLYNILIALYLAVLGTVGHHLGGVLLWPAVVLHAAVAAMLVRTRRRGG